MYVLFQRFLAPHLHDRLHAKPKPTVPNRFIAHIDTAFMKKVFYILSDSGNLTYSITASWMISGLVLKERKDTRLDMAQTLISSTLSGKVGYSDSADSAVNEIYHIV